MSHTISCCKRNIGCITNTFKFSNTNCEVYLFFYILFVFLKSQIEHLWNLESNDVFCLYSITTKWFTLGRKRPKHLVKFGIWSWNVDWLICCIRCCCCELCSPDMTHIQLDEYLTICWIIWWIQNGFYLFLFFNRSISFHSAILHFFAGSL